MTDLPDRARARVFGSFAADYQRWRPTYPAAAIDWLLPPGASVVADVGAGTGKLTALLLQRGVAVQAIEPDADMLAELSRQCPTAVPQCAPAEALPLADSSLDAVLVAQAWHWFDHAAALVEVRRVLRPGGWLGIIGNGPWPRESWQLAIARLDPDTPGGATDDDGLSNPWEHQGLDGVPFEAARFPWCEDITPLVLRSRLETYSNYAVMPAAERDRRLDEITALVVAQTQLTGLPTVPFDHCAFCVRIRL